MVVTPHDMAKFKAFWYKMTGFFDIEKKKKNLAKQNHTYILTLTI